MLPLKGGERKQGGGVAVGDCRSLFRLDAKMLCNAAADVRNIAAFVSLSSIRNRGEVGRIGFEHNAVDSYFGKNCRNCRFLESDNAIDTEIEVAKSAASTHIVD